MKHRLLKYLPGGFCLAVVWFMTALLWILIVIII